MKLYGSLKELVSAVFRNAGSGFQVTVRENQSTVYSADRDVQLPDQDANGVLTSRNSTDTLTNKTINGASNTLTVLAGSQITGQLPTANGGTGQNSTATFPTSGVVVTEAASETLTNKTISGSSNTLTVLAGSQLSGQVPTANGGTGQNSTATFPTSGVVVTEAATETLTNKTLVADTTTVVDQVDPTKTLKFDLDPTAAGVDTLVRFNNVVDATMNFPTTAQTLVGRTSIDTMSNKTLTSPTLNTPIVNTATLNGAVVADYEEFTQVSTPSNPASGKDRLYFKSDDRLYKLTAAGAESAIDSSGSGSGEINTITNPSASSDTTGWTAGTSHSVARDISNSPLSPVVATSLAMTATTTASESSTSGVYWTTSTQPTGLRNRKLKVEFYFTTAASQTWNVGVYAGSTRMSLSTDSSSATTIPSGVTGGKFTTYFDADSSTAYTIHFTRTAGAGTDTLYVTNVINGPGIQPQGAVVGEWQTYTPTLAASSGGVARASSNTETAYWRRVGTNMEIMYSYAQSSSSGATSGTGTYTWTIPTGYTIDTAKLQASSNTTRASTGAVGVATFQNGSDGYTGEVRVWDDNELAINIGNQTVSPQNAGSANGGFGATNVVQYSFHASVPISEWAGAGVVNLAQNDAEYAYNTSTSDAADTTSFAYGPSGGALPGALSVARKKRVRFSTPIQVTDQIIFQVSEDGTTWTVTPTVLAGSSYLSFDNADVGAYWIQVNSTDVDVEFHRYRAGTGNWNSIAGARWRLVKTKSGQAVGFGVVNQLSSGLMPASNSSLDNASATRLGLKAYAHGTSYNGGNAPTVTLSGGGGTLSSVQYTAFYPRQLNDGSWVLNGQVSLTLSSTSRTNPTFAINGVTAASLDINVAGAVTNVSAAIFRCTFNGGTISMVYAAVSGTTHQFNFHDVPLTAKPNWAY